MPLQETQTKVQKLVHTYCGPWIRSHRRTSTGRQSEQTLSTASGSEAAGHMEQCGKGALTSPLQLTHLRLGGSLRSPRTIRSFLSSSFLDAAAIAHYQSGHSTAPLSRIERGAPPASSERFPRAKSGRRNRREQGAPGKWVRFFCSGRRAEGSRSEAWRNGGREWSGDWRRRACPSAGSALVCVWFLPFRTGLPLSLCWPDARTCTVVRW
jgi:hypothetical protein